jgi:hypothetical protein
MRFDKAATEPTENLPELIGHVISDEHAARISHKGSLGLAYHDTGMMIRTKPMMLPKPTLTMMTMTVRD